MLDFVAPRKSVEDGVPEEQVCATYCRRRRFETATPGGKCEFSEQKCGFKLKSCRVYIGMMRVFGGNWAISWSDFLE